MYRSLMTWTPTRFLASDVFDVEIRCETGAVLPSGGIDRVVVSDTLPTDVPPDAPVGVSRRVYSNTPHPSQGGGALFMVSVESHLCFEVRNLRYDITIAEAIEIARSSPERGEMRHHGGKPYSAHEADIIREHVRICRRKEGEKIHIYVNSSMVTES